MKITFAVLLLILMGCREVTAPNGSSNVGFRPELLRGKRFQHSSDLGKSIYEFQDDGILLLSVFDYTEDSVGHIETFPYLIDTSWGINDDGFLWIGGDPTGYYELIAFDASELVIRDKNGREKTWIRLKENQSRKRTEPNP